MKALITIIFIILLINVGSAKEFRGHLTPIADLDLSFPETGVISSIAVKEGDIVTQDQVLCELSHDELKARLTQQKELLKLQEARFKKLQEIKATGNVSNDEIYRVTADRNTALAQVQEIEAMIQKRIIQAPTDGIVTQIFFKKGEGVAGIEKPVMKLMDIRKLELTLYVDEAIGRSLKVGDIHTIKLPGGDIKGSIYFIAPDVDPASSTIRTVIHVDNIDLKWRSGLTGIVNLGSDPKTP